MRTTVWRPEVHGARALASVALCLVLMACGDEGEESDPLPAPAPGEDFSHCESSTDCDSGYCADLGSLGGDPSSSVCSATCSNRDVQDSCPDGFLCQLEDGLYWCAPTCQSSADCTQNAAHSHCQSSRGVCVGRSEG